MTVRQIGNEPQPKDVTFPPGRTTLEFKAQASPATGVMVTYHVETDGVTFENGTPDELLDNAPVAGQTTTVKKPVRFTFDGDTPPLQIKVSGTATPLDGSPSFSLRWTVHVDADVIGGGANNFIAASASRATAPDRTWDRASNSDPAKELVALMRRACGLLEAILASSRQTGGKRAARKGSHKKAAARKSATKRSSSRA